ncbi:hypothetical protein [Streptomyces iranensis]|uniref:RNA polymerase, sigma 28 subunit, Sig B/F/Gsubfamily n=1 Tax=Streptomyces iranensis TaxID=576784 RepID=A0A060ZHW1_9ACTN|nr:hypothetical protein [Streptomyces iranensis]MBP2061099.1 hypothetical protein [Streptomyces iranensis]CDR05635.1 RNA polymerase, sigma 28 subunit, Sig B/F/Gsubfamily [Streptomyces iranensis]
MASVRAHHRAHPRHPHDDAPDTSAELRRIAGRLGTSQMRVSRLLSDACARPGRQAGARAA